MRNHDVVDSEVTPRVPGVSNTTNATSHAKILDVVVTGATGQQGGALARILLSKGHRVRALTRKTSGATARHLASLGATVLAADLDTGEGLEAAVDGADAVFLVTTPFERGAEAEIVQARHVGTAAAGVPHLVYSSVTLALTRSPVEHFAAKGDAERLLASMNLPLTIIGAPPFMDNVIAPWHLPWLAKGVWALPVPYELPMQMVLSQDIGAVAAHVIEHRERFLGQRVDIATQAITGAAMKAELEAASGRTFRNEPKSFAELDPLLGKLFAGIESGGGGGGAAAPPEARGSMPADLDLAALRDRLPGVAWSDFASWARAQDWDALLRGA